MHSSRMRTARLLPVSPRMHCSGGVPGPGVYLVLGGGGVPGPGGGGTCPGTPLMNRMTNRCKNIALPQTSFAGDNDAQFNHRHSV